MAIIAEHPILANRVLSHPFAINANERNFAILCYTLKQVVCPSLLPPSLNAGIPPPLC